MAAARTLHRRDRSRTLSKNDLKSRRKYIIAESILVLIALGAGIAIVATFHRKSTTKVVAPGSTSSTAGTTPGAGSGSGSGTGSGSGSQGSGGSTGATGPGGGTQPGAGTTSGVPPTGAVTNDTSGCTDCGQEPNPGRCSGWTESFTNNSNTDVTGITIDPPAGKFTAPGRTWPTPDPASVTLNLDIKPSTTQKVRFLTCSPMAPPASDARFVATPPAKFSWQWITGQHGSACFGAAC